MPSLPTIRICYNVFLRWHGKDAGALAFGRHPGSGVSFSSCVGSCVKAHRAEVASIAGRHQPACGNSSLSLRPGRNLKQKSWNDSGFAKQIPAGTGASGASCTLARKSTYTSETLEIERQACRDPASCCIPHEDTPGCEVAGDTLL